MQRVHRDGAHPAPVVNLALHIDVDEATPAWVAHDHIQAMEEVPREEPSNALAPQIDGFLGTERLRNKLVATEVQHFDIFANDMEEVIVTLGEVLEHAILAERTQSRR